MHELSICRNLIEQVEYIAAEHHARSISAIYLQIGPLSGLEPKLLRSAFPIASAGTLAEQAALFIQSVPIRIACLGCGTESEASTRYLRCRQCDSSEIKLLSGDELLLERVQMQTGQPPRMDPHIPR